jgi:hypothetical protein
MAGLGGLGLGYAIGAQGKGRLQSAHNNLMLQHQSDFEQLQQKDTDIKRLQNNLQQSLANQQALEQKVAHEEKISSNRKSAIDRLTQALSLSK